MCSAHAAVLTKRSCAFLRNSSILEESKFMIPGTTYVTCWGFIEDKIPFCTKVKQTCHWRIHNISLFEEKY
jgi:hypothetical protein